MRDQAAAPTTADVDALQTTLAAEHAAIYVYGVLGARTSQSAAPLLFEAVRASYVEHRDRRDELIGLLADAGAEPAAAAPAYEIASGAAADIAATAAALEASCATTYAAQVGSTAGETRRVAIGWLAAAALRGLALGAAPEVLPGADDLLD